MGALWELPGSSLGALWELVAVAGIELVDWTTTNKFARLWFCEDIHHSSILKLAIKKAIQKSPNWNFSSKIFEDDSNDEKKQFVGFVSSHKRAHCCHPSIFTALLFSIQICRRTQFCDMHPYITESHYVKYAGPITSAYAIDTISSCVIVFHSHHQSLYWRRILPRSNLYRWL
jgi:hypothetical protein